MAKIMAIAITIRVMIVIDSARLCLQLYTISYRMISQRDFNHCQSPLIQDVDINPSMKQYLIDNRVAGIHKSTVLKAPFLKNHFKTIYVNTTHVACITKTNQLVFIHPEFIHQLWNTNVDASTFFQKVPPVSTSMYRDRELKHAIRMI